MSCDKNALSISMLHVSMLTDTSLSKYSSGHLFAKKYRLLYIVSIIMIIGPDMRTFTGKTIFLTVSLNICFGVLKRTVSMRRFF